MPRPLSVLQYVPPDTFRAELDRLVTQFSRHRDEYLKPTYSEAQVRLDFIDPLFEALGWDVRNRSGLDPASREVIVERGQTVGRLDYNFRLLGQTKFFAEAKAPHVPLARSNVILQAKKYAWNTTEQFVYFTAISDFEEFRLYDASRKPDPRHPEAGLIFTHRYTDYLSGKALANLWLLSREAVAAGSLERLLRAGARRERERVPLDKQFLADLTAWREQLAKAVFKLHADLTPADLNSVVQVFLDRLIFIRLAEDRGVLTTGRLRQVAQAWRAEGRQRPITADLLPLFRAVNQELNGEIFKLHLTEQVKWDSALVAEIIEEGLEPYSFAQIGVEMLGSIYERYLGKTIRVTATRAVVEDKPEVRKAGGVYYTPRYIVDYIVGNTVGQLIAGKSPKQIAKLRILDPACGSGSFLIGAYQYLLDYHLKWYAEHRRMQAAGQAEMFTDAETGERKLSIAEKARILKSNIFGVDIDPQAVQITMMSLYIKLLEGERGLPYNNGLLPMLGTNIKCGNSLIGLDTFRHSERTADAERIRPFEWESKREGFGTIVEAGGFDVVIGNPPYVRPHNIPDDIKELLWSAFSTFVAKSDMYSCFMERGLTLTRPAGLFSFIVPQTWTSLESFAKIREFILSRAKVRKLVQLPPRVFADAAVETCIFVFERRPVGARTSANQIAVEKLQPNGKVTREREFSQADIEQAHLFNFQLRAREGSQSVIEKVKNRGRPLSNVVAFTYGFKTGDDDQFIHARKRSKESKPFIRSAAVHRYGHDSPKEYVWYVPERMIENRKTARPGDAARFEAEKIIVARMGTALGATFDPGGLYVKDAMLLVSRGDQHSLKFILGLINSRLLTFFYQEFFVTIDVLKNALLSLPIRSINFSDTVDKARHDEIVRLVERMLMLHQRKATTTSPAALARLNSEINATDEKIDKLVYVLYGLTKEEIGIVESA